MIPLTEFVERLEAGRKHNVLNFRACNVEIEAARKRGLSEKLNTEIKQTGSIHPTYWRESEDILNKSEKQEEVSDL